MLFVLLACTPTTTTAAPPPATPVDSTERKKVRWRMSEHFEKGTAARDAAVAGQVGLASTALSGLGEHLEPGALGEAGRPLIEALVGESQKATAATTPEEMGVGIGNVVSTCANCHSAFAVKLPPITAKLSATPDAKGGHAERGAWVIGALWTGAITNGALAWDKGAEELGRIPADAWGGGDGEAALRATATIKTQMTAALAAEDRASRAASLGQVVGACGACHAENKK